MALSDILNSYTSISLYSRYSLSSHSVRVAQKNVVLHKKLCCVNKKNISHRNISHQNYVSHKKNMLWQQKKLSDAKKRDSCLLNTFSVAQKRNTC